ncbi:hypothetical protein Tco_1537328 [Tanacetum coccineum]
MADSWKAMDLNRFVVKDDMIDYVLHKYGSNWQVHDAIVDDILDDLFMIVTPPNSGMQRNGNNGVLRQSTTIKI